MKNTSFVATKTALPEQQYPAPQPPTNRPIQRFRAGAVSAAIWRNATQDGEFFSITLERAYKAKDGSWQHTGSLRLNDLPKAALVLHECYRHLALGGEEE